MIILRKVSETRQIFDHLSFLLIEFQILVTQKIFSFAINVLKIHYAQSIFDIFQNQVTLLIITTINGVWIFVVRPPCYVQFFLEK